jgi:hypothetical protein
MTKEQFRNRWNYIFKHDHEGAYKNLIFLIFCGGRLSPHEHSEETLKKNLERIKEQRRAKQGVAV